MTRIHAYIYVNDSLAMHKIMPIEKIKSFNVNINGFTYVMVVSDRWAGLSSLETVFRN